MKVLTSFRELDALGTGLSKEYIRKTRRWDSACFDIEGFITDYLGLPVVYETIAEEDRSKIGFLSDGSRPLMICRGNKVMEQVFPKDTVVIDQYLLRSDESGRRRFTLAHEAAHYIIEQHLGGMPVASFLQEYDGTATYSQEELERMFSLSETMANRLGASLLMPEHLVRKALVKYNEGRPVVFYDGGIFSVPVKLTVQKMADSLGVSYSAFLTRLRELNLMERHPIEEYIEKELCFGDAR